MIATPIYAAALALLFVALGVRVVMLRRSLNVTLGDEGRWPLRKAVRAHANFAEYVPLALLLMFFLETRTHIGAWIHGLGSALLVGRIVHAIGVSRVQEDIRARVFGMICSFGVIVVSAGLLLWHGARAALL